MSLTPLVSIIINNYNYDSYLAEAVDSALAQTYSNCEVIVVDDGSIDRSRAIIEGYGGELKAVFKSNGGQASAFNAGFGACSGDWVLFLDADDVLETDAVESLLDYLKQIEPTPDLMPFYLKNVDEKQLPVEGSRRTPARLTESRHLEILLKTGSYSFAPTSGNFFSRGLLDRLLPMPETEFRISADLYLLTASPFYARISIYSKRCLGKYRIHGSNNFFVSAPRSIEAYRKKLISDLRNEAKKQELIREFAKRENYKVGRYFGQTSTTLIFRRLVATKLADSEAAFPSDRPLMLVGALVRSVLNVRRPKQLLVLLRTLLAAVRILPVSANKALFLASRIDS